MGGGGMSAGGMGGQGGMAIVGTCQEFKDPGAQCGADNECFDADPDPNGIARFCVDGVCCESACTGLCERCDVAGEQGECVPAGTPSAPFIPSGAQLCDGSGGPCEGFCQGQTTDTCSYPEGESLSVPHTCACTDASTCEETTTLCSSDDPGQTSLSLADCLGYRCTDADGIIGDSGVNCATTCTSNEECVFDFLCIEGQCQAHTADYCVPAEAGAQTLILEPGGTSRDCAPYRCSTETNACLEPCQSVEDCATGFICDATNVCSLPPESPTVETCNCSLPGSADGDGNGKQHVGWLLAGLALVVARRRRR